MREDIESRFHDHRGSKARDDKYPRKREKLLRADRNGEFMSLPRGMKKTHEICDRAKWGATTDPGILRRFLMSCRGRLWDEVYSEICETVDCRTYSGKKIFETLEWMVDCHCVIDENGDIWNKCGGTLFSRWRYFYVHPETGKLEHSPRPKKSYKEKFKSNVFQIDDQWFHKHNGIWYRVTMQPVTIIKRQRYDLHFYDRNFCDAFGAHLFEEGQLRGKTYYFYDTIWTNLERQYGRNPNGELWYCVSKESANSKEIDKLKKLHGQV
jgi:hypothetical protein